MARWAVRRFGKVYNLNFCNSILIDYKLPKEYIPIDSFEAEGVFFYNRKTEEVLYIELGQMLSDFQNNKLTPQWKSFNLFLECFFGIS